MSELTRAIETTTELEQLEGLIGSLHDASNSVPGWMGDVSGLDAFIAKLERAYDSVRNHLEREGVL